MWVGGLTIRVSTDEAIFERMRAKRITEQHLDSFYPHFNDQP